MATGPSTENMVEVQVKEIPEVATPWEDPLGNVWCVTAAHIVNGVRCVRVRYWNASPPAGWADWGPITTYTCHPALLAGLGRTLPEEPTPAWTTPKRVAQVVRYGEWELAVRGNVLYERTHGDDWRPSNDWFINRDFFTLIAEAFTGAGDVLPGEE